MPPLEDCDQVLVAFSGGKDSLACLLRLLELGVPRNRFESRHHLVGSREVETVRLRRASQRKGGSEKTSWSSENAKVQARRSARAS